MSKKNDIINGILKLADTSIAEIKAIPDGILDAIAEYDCECKSSDGTLKLKLVVTLTDD